MEKYQSYKQSGVDWIGEIPFNWEVRRIKFLFKSIVEKSIDGSEELLSVSEKKGIIPRRELRDENEELSRSESLEGYLKVKKDDLVNNIMLMWKRGLGFSNYNGIVSPSYSVFRLNGPNIPSFWNYLLRTDLYVTEYRRNSTGVIDSRLRLYDDSFGNIFSILPPLQEQIQIVQFLDEKTELIEKLISTKERKITLLKEQRTSLINQVVTKGLNPNVKMKDSGVEWIGEIPEGWIISKIKHNIGIRTGFSFKSEDFVDESFPNEKVPVVRISNIQDGYIDLKGSVYLPKNYTENYKEFVLLKGDILICLTGSLTGKVGVFEHDLGLLNQRVGKFFYKNEDKVYNSYFSFYIKQELVQKLIKQMGEGISENFPNVSHLDVIELNLTIPPFEEQIRIVEFLDSKTKEIDDLVQLEQKKVNLLKEYRQSLISEVVTGKIKVTTDE
jgi:type I restriction enzyme S subunit